MHDPPPQPLTSEPPRRFGILDMMLLIAACALGMAVGASAPADPVARLEVTAYVAGMLMVPLIVGGQWLSGHRQSSPRLGEIVGFVPLMGPIGAVAITAAGSRLIGGVDWYPQLASSLCLAILVGFSVVALILLAQACLNVERRRQRGWLEYLGCAACLITTALIVPFLGSIVRQWFWSM